MICLEKHMSKMCDIFHYGNLRPPSGETTQYLLSSPEGARFVNKYSLVDTGTFVGIEIEAENFDDAHEISEAFQAYWSLTNDGSLRNHGIECVSRPMKGNDILMALMVWEREIQKWDCLRSNARCGIHVHVNFQDKDLVFLRKFLMLYAVFENSLFRVSGERSDNIFCLPITQTENAISEFVREGKSQPLIRAVCKGEKYSALNIAPLKSYGTLEFRHMETRLDSAEIINWVNTILALYKACDSEETLQSLKERIETLNTTSEYLAFCRETLPDSVFDYLVNDYHAQAEMSVGVEWVKEVFIAPERLWHRVTRARKVFDAFEIMVGNEAVPAEDL